MKKRLLEIPADELETTSLEDILDHEDVQLSSSVYHAALSISARGATVILERKPDEIWINNYNPQFMTAWTANMDIQFCTDSYAVITYITDYLTKSDAGLTKELRNALNETKSCNNFEQLNHLKMIYFKNKQVSVAEATYRLIRGLDLKKSNTASIYLATGYPRNRSTFFKPALSKDKSVDVSNLNDEEEPLDETDGNTPIALEGRQGFYKEVETIHSKYSQRPKILNDICLAQFATSYSYTKADRIPRKHNGQIMLQV